MCEIVEMMRKIVFLRGLAAICRKKSDQCFFPADRTGGIPGQAAEFV